MLQFMNAVGMRTVVMLTLTSCVCLAVDDGQEDCAISAVDLPSPGNSRAGRCLLQSQKEAVQKKKLGMNHMMLDTLPGHHSHYAGAIVLDQMQAGNQLTASLGVRVKSGVVTILGQGSALPAENSIVLTSSESQQTEASVEVIQDGTTLIGTATIESMPSLALHEHRVGVTFVIDSTCTLKVYANAEMTQSGAEFTLLGSYSMSICTSDVTATTATTTAASTIKKGIICMDKTGCDSKNAKAMEGHVSWMYNYNQRIDVVDKPAPDMLKWANDNNIEFVPMVSFRYLQLKDGEKCYFVNRATLTHIPDSLSDDEDKIDSIRDLADCDKTRCCEDHEIWELFDQLVSEMSTKPKYLMGFNEPYHAKKGMDYKNIPALEAADYHRTVLQPIADRYGFEIVSPTTGPDTGNDDGISSGKTAYFADLLVACWKMRKSSPPCNIERMTKVSIHKYTCKGSYWEDNFGDTAISGGEFNSDLKKLLKDKAPFAPQLQTYVDGLKYWVTEHNCNWDGSKDNGPSPTAQCKIVTGQTGGIYGEGSLKVFERLPSIERYSWWNLYNGRDRQMTQVARMTNIDGSLTPIGRAYTNGLSESTDCNALGSTFTLARFEEMFTCSGGSEIELGNEDVDDNCLEKCMIEAGALAKWCCNWNEFNGKCTFVTGDFVHEEVPQKSKFAALFPPRDFNTIQW